MTRRLHQSLNTTGYCLVMLTVNDVDGDDDDERGRWRRRKSMNDDVLTHTFIYTLTILAVLLHHMMYRRQRVLVSDYSAFPTTSGRAEHQSADLI